MIFGANIKLLRNRRGRTQEEVSIGMDISRSKLNGYENGHQEPGLETLVLISKYYKVSVDTLLKVDLTKLSESQLGEIERGFDT